MAITIRFSSNADLNSLIALADAAYNAGEMEKFQTALDLIDRHFYSLSIVPSLA